MITIALANQKGGVGKSTSVASLGVECARRGHRTLLVAADPQANASAFFLPISEVERGLEEALRTPATAGLADLILETQFPALKLVPSTSALVQYNQETSLRVGRLKTALATVSADFDYCFIDTPPLLGMVLSAALAAADYVLIPCQGEAFSLDALRDILATIEEAQVLNPNLQIAGTFLTMYNGRTSIGQAVRQALRNSSLHHFEAAIRRQVKLAECPAQNMPIQLYAPDSAGAQDYAALATELLSYLSTAAAGTFSRTVSTATHKAQQIV